jgi:predicted AlkP superfamily phosphohydrolase/phosphomutase
MSHTKLLVIGLDGATLDLVEPWAANGVLPTFSRLLQAGSHGPLRSVPNTDTAPAWATFATGLNPANHGLFHELGWSADRRTLRPTRGADRHGQSFWRIASDAGHRVIVINVPSTYPAEPVNGVMLAGVDAPGTDAPGFCHPAGWSIEGYRIESEIQAAIKEDRAQDGIDDARRVTQLRTETLIRAMDQAPWDLAVIVYSMPDVLQHFFWRQMVDGTDPFRHAIRDGYILLDRQIERLLEHAGEDTDLIILSDHGFGPICATPGHLDAWLKRRGFTQMLDPRSRPWRQRLVSDAYAWLRHGLSERQKTALRRCFPGLRSRVESDARFAGVDWSQTVAFAGPSPFEIWVNRQGRDPQGIVTPGAEYEAVCGRLASALLEWEDPGTGGKRVRAVYRRGDVYAGRYLDLAPDLTIEWNVDAAPPSDSLEGNTSRFNADHTPDGLLVAAGPGLRPGVVVQNASLQDIAPTILELLGIPAPAKMDGRILEQLCRPATEE